MDDNRVDYISMLGVEDIRKRFSEDVVDRRTKDQVMINKMLREMQRQAHAGGRVSSIVTDS